MQNTTTPEWSKNMLNRPELKEWQALITHQKDIANQHMRDWFNEDPERFSRFSLSASDILLDYSRNRITDNTMALLDNLANAVGLKEQIEALFSGKRVNNTENRPALHTALRDSSHAAITVNDENVATLISEAQQRLRAAVSAIHSGEWRGSTSRPFTHIVNIGIGGSYTGPMMCTYALQAYATSRLQFHFISSVDKNHVDEILQRIDPETTLFIISSKSFTTIETLTNAETVIAWMKDRLGADILQHQFAAVTSARAKAVKFGIPEARIFPVWEWVGGRYSVWSAIGLPLMLMLGNAGFDEFLAGADSMDQHFRTAAFRDNMPVILALLGVWYSNFFGAHAQAIVPYAHRLRYFIPYLQQADMESNGKRNNLQGEIVSYTTGPVIFGEEGVIGQHAYHQLLHQGPQLIPADFILTGNDGTGTDIHQNIIIASALSQAQALMRGKTYEEAREQLIAAKTFQ